jgi:hypothetical protein
MKTFAWFVAGVAGGLALGHIVANDPRGKALLADVESRAREFVGGVKDGFDDRLSHDSTAA